MIGKLKTYLLDLRDRQRITIALTKGGTMMHRRAIDLRKPCTWEFSGFSQNGEDGILDVLRRNLLRSNRYFVEIGAADGLENNSAWLVVAEKYSGLMIEGNSELSERARKMLSGFSIGLRCVHAFVCQENISDLLTASLYRDPDVFSLDIDGIDYYVADEVFKKGLRPKIFLVEYNSVFGPDRSATIVYERDFTLTKAHRTQLYYGVSISGWRRFFDRQGYRFITVEQNGVNAFFVDPACFERSFLDGIQGLEFAENRYQYTKFAKPSSDQFALIADRPFVSI